MAASIVFALGLAACAGEIAQPTPLARDNLMYSHQPQVRFMTAKATSAVVISAGTRQPINLGDAVTVDDHGQARLRFSDFLVVDVYRNTELRDIECPGSVDPNAPPAFRMRLEEGSVFCNVDVQQIAGHRVRPEFRIDTQWAVIHALGTQYWVNYNPASQVTWVVVKEGAAGVTGAGKEVIVRANEQTWVEPGKPPVDPIPACRNLIGNRFPLIDELTNGDRADLELLCKEGTLPSIARAAVATPTPKLRPTRTPTARPGQLAPRRATPSRQQPTATPAPTRQSARTPTPTREPTTTPTPTHTPSPTLIPSATPFVVFDAYPDMAPVCSTCMVSWDTGNVAEVYYQGGGVTGNEVRQEFIPTIGRNTFNLDVVYRNGQRQRFTTATTGDIASPGSSLRRSVDEQLSSAPEISIIYSGSDLYRCMGRTAIPAIAQADLPSTQVLSQQIDDPGPTLSTWLQAGAAPAFLVLVYPSQTIASLDSIISNWPLGAQLYAWDQGSDSLQLLQYRTGPPPAPDLVVTSFKTTGPAQSVSDGYQLPVRLTVANQGNAEAGRFKVAVEYTVDQGSYVVPFVVPGQSDPWYPYTASLLAPGASVAFDGAVTFTSLSGLNCAPLALVALADSCASDEFMPATCRVAESDEGNNASAPLITQWLFCIE